MQTIFYWLGRALVGFIQLLPIEWVARLGRLGGTVAYALDARHRGVARRNLAASFPEKPPAEITELARENLRRIGENFACAVKTATMSDAELAPRLKFNLRKDVVALFQGSEAQRMVFAIGHFGNFELYARCLGKFPRTLGATTYRALRQPGLNRLLTELRNRSGCRFFERRLEGTALREAMNQPRIILGLLADQSAGGTRLRLPFFGRDCSTSSAPAVFALRYGCELGVAICYRTGLARWRVEMGDLIPVREEGEPRPIADIMRDVNRAFEAAVRRDPANWFWVHNRWKKPRDKKPAPSPEATEEQSI